MITRPSAVAGTFYPASPQNLRNQLRSWIDSRRAPTSDIQAIIAPHAGYVYSGACAACVYARLDAERIRRVIIFAPAHTLAFPGIALSDATAFATPLGHVPVDAEATEVAQSLPGVLILPRAHAMEHAIEVQLPFLQYLLKDFSILPLCVSHIDAAHVRDVMAALWDLENSLIVVSSDLSHYLDAEQAEALDGQTLASIQRLEAQAIEARQACGATSIRALLMQAQARKLQAEILDYRHSGAVNGDRSRVVGYAAVAMRQAR